MIEKAANGMGEGMMELLCIVERGFLLQKSITCDINLCLRSFIPISRRKLLSEITFRSIINT